MTSALNKCCDNKINTCSISSTGSIVTGNGKELLEQRKFKKDKEANQFSKG